MWGLVGGSCSGFWRVGSHRPLLADKGLSLEMIKIALWFIEQALFGDFALLNLLNQRWGPLSRSSLSVGRAGTHSTCAQVGSWGRSSQEGRAWQWGASRGSQRSLT